MPTIIIVPPNNRYENKKLKGIGMISDEISAKKKPHPNIRAYTYRRVNCRKKATRQSGTVKNKRPCRRTKIL